ncbi:hypothetical protein EDEG_01645 [Edhazardia aedis USNM 41457]|uniref:Vesicular-fusion protein SEC18 n=1 Tax=Edhazardia aedis (strain USNM 41457) TaxID=1003232 RepID=J9D9B7_EDHAE|nr:hypothetical protein EDEG_01645 [Edhazardia aedis USNM 41457]|eukprot:EJW04069.1 hypothetical protein EDEG_01645 [Edhazardia aedis USNM 41457]
MIGKAYTFEVSQLMSPEMGTINQVYLSQVQESNDEYFINIDGKIFHFVKDTNLANSKIYLNNAQREFLQTTLQQKITGNMVLKSKFQPISLVRINIEPVNIGMRTADRKELIEIFKTTYVNFPFNIGQIFYFFTEELTFKANITEMLVSKESSAGFLDKKTRIFFTTTSQRLTMTGADEDSALLRSDFSFEEMGIGALSNEFNIMFRRAFVQRIFDTETIKKLGIPHVKGILLYGPPGTGKTLIARKIGTLLNAKPPQIVNGPEILNKYVGQSEENIRNLFKNAEKDYATFKEKSPLHIIIFDELDAIFKTRGSSAASSGIGDQIVNQLLSKMDGVEALDNILIIGMTNRPDLIDKALLRPGRFEIHIEIKLPDEKGRLEIFKIHTKSMKNSGYLADDVCLEELAKLSRNYTGAEICALVKSAASFALERKVRKAQSSSDKENEFTSARNDCKKQVLNSKISNLEISDQNAKLVAENDVIISMNDFISALDEIKPGYGYDESEFSLYTKVYYELPIFTHAFSQIQTYISKLRGTSAYTSSSFLLYGPPGSGKTNVAVKAALASKFPFVKMISPKNLVGLSENEKVNYIKEKFIDAYKSQESLIILDEIESLIDFVSIGPRFSNNILQAIKIFVKNEEKNKLFVIGTTSEKELLVECGIFDCFYGACEVGFVSKDDFSELCTMNSDFNSVKFTNPVSIKNLLSKCNTPPKAFN